MTLSIFVHVGLYGSRKYPYPMEGTEMPEGWDQRIREFERERERERERGGGGGAGSVKKFSSCCSVIVIFLLAS